MSSTIKRLLQKGSFRSSKESTYRNSADLNRLPTLQDSKEPTDGLQLPRDPNAVVKARHQNTPQQLPSPDADCDEVRYFLYVVLTCKAFACAKIYPQWVLETVWRWNGTGEKLLRMSEIELMLLCPFNAGYAGIDPKKYKVNVMAPPGAREMIGKALISVLSGGTKSATSLGNRIQRNWDRERARTRSNSRSTLRKLPDSSTIQTSHYSGEFAPASGSSISSALERGEIGFPGDSGSPWDQSSHLIQSLGSSGVAPMASPGCGQNECEPYVIPTFQSTSDLQASMDPSCGQSASSDLIFVPPPTTKCDFPIDGSTTTVDTTAEAFEDSLVEQGEERTIEGQSWKSVSPFESDTITPSVLEPQDESRILEAGTCSTPSSVRGHPQPPLGKVTSRYRRLSSGPTSCLTIPTVSRQVDAFQSTPRRPESHIGIPSMPLDTSDIRGDPLIAPNQNSHNIYGVRLDNLDRLTQRNLFDSPNPVPHFQRHSQITPYGQWALSQDPAFTSYFAQHSQGQHHAGNLDVLPLNLDSPPLSFASLPLPSPRPYSSTAQHEMTWHKQITGSKVGLAQPSYPYQPQMTHERLDVMSNFDHFPAAKKLSNPYASSADGYIPASRHSLQPGNVDTSSKSLFGLHRNASNEAVRSASPPTSIDTNESVRSSRTLPSYTKQALATAFMNGGVVHRKRIAPAMPACTSDSRPVNNSKVDAHALGQAQFHMWKALPSLERSQVIEAEKERLGIARSDSSNGCERLSTRENLRMQGMIPTNLRGQRNHTGPETRYVDPVTRMPRRTLMETILDKEILEGKTQRGIDRGIKDWHQHL